MKTCPSCDHMAEDDAARCRCGYEFMPSFSPGQIPTPKNHPANARAVFAILLIIVGIAVTWYFAAGYDTSVDVVHEVSGVVVPERVENSGLLQNRLIGVLIGLSCAISGVILIAAPSQNPPR